MEAILDLFAREKFDEIVKLSKTIPVEFIGGYRIYIALSYAELGNHKEAMETFIELFQYNNTDKTSPTHPLNLVEQGDVINAYNQLIDHVQQSRYRGDIEFLTAVLSLYNGEMQSVPKQLAKIPFSRDTNALNAIHMWPIFYDFKNNSLMQETLKRIGVAPLALCVHDVCKKN